MYISEFSIWSLRASKKPLNFFCQGSLCFDYPIRSGGGANMCPLQENAIYSKLYIDK